MGPGVKLGPDEVQAQELPLEADHGRAVLLFREAVIPPMRFLEREGWRFADVVAVVAPSTINVIVAQSGVLVGLWSASSWGPVPWQRSRSVPRPHGTRTANPPPWPWMTNSRGVPIRPALRTRRRAR